MSKKRSAALTAESFIDMKKNPGHYCTENILGNIYAGISKGKIKVIYTLRFSWEITPYVSTHRAIKYELFITKNIPPPK
ncbi:hypothetical protein [Rothia sp. HMSC061E04]|uniref:hypothetical protein n=1 Tax=Rothia TaxID=32207 RepID=UPI00114D088E|nr:hypothetical protein [Rothia sp. HMSC061E04]